MYQREYLYDAALVNKLFVFFSIGVFPMPGVKIWSVCVCMYVRVVVYACVCVGRSSRVSELQF